MGLGCAGSHRFGLWLLVLVLGDMEILLFSWSGGRRKVWELG